MIYPCAGWQGCIIGNFQTETLKNIWFHSSVLNKLRNLRRYQNQIDGCAQ
ncbi:SPASM domain-containing protein [uncultured Rikenella sp.]